MAGWAQWILCSLTKEWCSHGSQCSTCSCHIAQVACLFLHTSWSHLAVNVYCLWCEPKGLHGEAKQLGSTRCCSGTCFSQWDILVTVVYIVFINIGQHRYVMVYVSNYTYTIIYIYIYICIHIYNWYGPTGWSIHLKQNLRSRLSRFLGRLAERLMGPGGFQKGGVKMGFYFL